MYIGCVPESLRCASEVHEAHMNYYNITTAVRFFALLAGVNEAAARSVCARLVAHLIFQFGSVEGFAAAAGSSDCKAFDNALFAMLGTIAENKLPLATIDLEELAADYAASYKHLEWFESTEDRSFEFFQNVADDSYSWVVLE